MKNTKLVKLLILAIVSTSVCGCSAFNDGISEAVSSFEGYEGTDDYISVTDNGNSTIGELNDETEPVTEEMTEEETEADTEPVYIPDDGITHVERIELDRYTSKITVGMVDMAWTTMYPTNASDKSEVWSSSDESVATVDEYGRFTGVGVGKCKIVCRSGDSATSGVKAVMNVTVVEYPNNTSPTYIDGIMIVNKSYPMPYNFTGDVDPTAKAAVDTMIADAEAEGISLWIISAYRTYEYQYNLYSNYLLRAGRDAADRYSARPGYSEHHTGLAFDLNSVEQSFGETKEGKWLAENCWKYGFIIRYPQDKEEITGYMYEPWHIRYLGVETAKKVYESGLCLEEYLGINSEYSF